MRVAITGSSGTIGSALAASLQSDGHEVVAIKRGSVPSLDGVDAVVNLAGAPIEKRWTDDHKKEIVASRLNTTTAVAHAIATATDGPKVFISGSAIGFYGDTGGKEVDESSPRGDDFLADLVVQWEAAAAEAEAAGVRVVFARTGIVQSPKGGMLGKQLLPFKLGLGGKIGSGDFYLSWVTLKDEVRGIRFAIDNDAIRGPMNLTAPHPVTNAEYTKALGEAVHRPTFMPIPKAALKLAMGGELVDSLLVSQRVLPKTLLSNGFVFAHPEITEGLKAVLKA